MELWGEALLAVGDANGAADRFAEANRYAPHWGRNHLMWGRALAKAGRTADARMQWKTAGGLVLSAPDRIELDRLIRT